mgnify:CR=1 FL=1
MLFIGLNKQKATPEMNYITSPYSESQSMSTLASSNKTNKNEVEMEMIYSEDEDETTNQGNLVQSKGPRSKERKLSNEDCQMLPPRAKGCVLLRPGNQFGSNKMTVPEKSNNSQQALKPKSILGFLQKSVNDKTQGGSKKGLEKAEFNGLSALSLTSSTGNSEALKPSFTLG